MMTTTTLGLGANELQALCAVPAVHALPQAAASMDTSQIIRTSEGGQR